MPETLGCIVQYCTFCTVFKLIIPFFISLHDNGSPYICDCQVGYSAGGYLLSPRWLLTWYFYPFFSGLAAPMSANIARNLLPLFCSCLNSYCTFHLFQLLLFFQIGCFLHFIQAVNPIFYLPT